MRTENSKTNKSNRLLYTFTDKLNLRNRNKSIALVNLSIYYSWKNVKTAKNNNKFKISAPALNGEFDLPDGSCSISNIQDFFEYIIKKNKTIADNSPIQIYIKK